MRLFAITMLRNEADIVETFVRHNLSVLDGIVAIDHGSVDATGEILTRLAQEGLPLTVLRDAVPGFFQAERLTALARQVIVREAADFVFPIDADEFLKVSSRAELERALAQVPPAANAVMHWLTYVPERFGEAEMPRLAFRRRREAHGSYKCIVARDFAGRKSWYIASGNHLVGDLEADKPPRHLRLPSSVVALAHCPVRSRRQLEQKIVLGHLSHLATRPDNDKHAFHWRELFEDLRDGVELGEARMRHVAFNYGLPREAWQAPGPDALVHDPVGFAFALRYSVPEAPDTLRVLMRFTEALLSR
jgi:hypothetical protein